MWPDAIFLKMLVAVMEAQREYGAEAHAVLLNQHGEAILVTLLGIFVTYMAYPLHHPRLHPAEAGASQGLSGEVRGAHRMD